MAPLHKALFALLRKLPSDGTFDQLAPVKLLYQKSFKNFWCYDLSAATDRLPVSLQAALISYLLGDEVGPLWSRSLVGRAYYVPKAERSVYSYTSLPQFVKYSVGQPMGALSS